MEDNNKNGNKEMRENIRNIKQDVDIASILVDIGWIRGKIDHIERAIFNEIPHQLDEIKKDFTREREDLRKELMGCIDETRKEMKELKSQLLYGFLIMIASSLILQIVLKFFNN